MVLATWTQVKKDEPRTYPAQVRKGLLQIMRVAFPSQPKYPGELAPFLEKKDFPFAIPEIHFHPADGTLLGAATSRREMHFFRFVKIGSILGRRTEVKLLELGSVVVAENDENKNIPVITRFEWFPELSTTGAERLNDKHTISFAITTNLNDVKIVKAQIPAIKDVFDHRLSHPQPPTILEITDVHKHDLEAWTSNSIAIGSEDGIVRKMLLSGGDDSALIASSIELDTSGKLNTASFP